MWVPRHCFLFSNSICVPQNLVTYRKYKLWYLYHCMYMWLSVCVCECVCVCFYMCVFMYMCECMCECVYVSVCLCVFECLCECVFFVGVHVCLLSTRILLNQSINWAQIFFQVLCNDGEIVEIATLDLIWLLGANKIFLLISVIYCEF